MVRRLWTFAIVVAGASLGWWLVSRWLAHMAPEPIPEQGLKPAPRREVVPVEPVQPAAPAGEPPAEASADEAGAGEHPSPAKEVQGDEAPEVRVYCLGCRAKQPVRNVRYETTPKGRRRLAGECAVCGRKVSQFVKG